MHNNQNKKKSDYNWRDIDSFDNLTSEDEEALYALLTEDSKEGRKFRKKEEKEKKEGKEEKEDTYHMVSGEENTIVSLPYSVLQPQLEDQENQQEKNNLRFIIGKKVVGSGGFSKVKKLKGTIDVDTEQQKVTVSKSSAWVVKVQGLSIPEKREGISLEAWKEAVNNRIQLWKKEKRKEFQLTKLVYPEAKHCFESSEDDKKHKHYLIIPKCPGRRLHEILKELNNFNFLERLEMAIAIAQAIKEVHKKGIVHRDISPRNIFYDKDTKKAYIIDFGLSKLAGEVDGITGGNLNYMAPETVEAKRDFSADVFSFGGVLLEILGATNISEKRLPYQGNKDILKNIPTIKTQGFNFAGFLKGIPGLETEHDQHELRPFLKITTALKKSQRHNLTQVVDKLRAVKYSEIVAGKPYEKELLEVFNLLQKRIEALERWNFINVTDHRKADLLRELQDAIIDPSNVDKTLAVILEKWEEVEHTYRHCNRRSNEKENVATKIVIGAHRNCFFTPSRLTATEDLIKQLKEDKYKDLSLGNEKQKLLAAYLQT
jgi:serine/threonine protein kinase